MKTFIYTYPRSMSAWLSVYLTLRTGMLYTHEALTRMPEVVFSESCGGNIGSDNLSVAEALYENYPDANHIFLERDFDECMASTRKILPLLSEEDERAIWNLGEKTKDAVPSLVTVKFSAEKLDFCKEICDILGIVWNERVTKELLRFNIQLNQFEWSLENF